MLFRVRSSRTIIKHPSTQTGKMYETIISQPVFTQQNQTSISYDKNKILLEVNKIMGFQGRKKRLFFKIPTIAFKYKGES